MLNHDLGPAVLSPLEIRGLEQVRLSDEHQKAKDNGYDTLFHTYIHTHGSKRLREEWKKNCEMRVISPQFASRSADLWENNCWWSVPENDNGDPDALPPQ